MEVGRAPVVRWAVAIAVGGAAISGCAHKPPSPWVPGPGAGTVASSTSPSPSTSTRTSSPTSQAPAAPPDYSSLLIKVADLGGDFTTPQPPVLNPGMPGVAQLFTNADNTRRIGDTILIVADPAAAVVGVANTRGNYASKVNGTWQSVDVGSNGTMISGTSPDNSQAVTALVFAEGKALVNLEFDSAANDPIDPAAAIDIGLKQDAAIKSGLPG
ncbi:hypothetical protein [Mycobacterium sp.]|uniref:hypothetical protein n=1 Tax=Mycobacterium sp. TaxID=1785 RepID=UPI0025E743D2|nr:hypothetical protein [Mycobacterium sp.]MBW0012516.1 hypothetical protein [Mycobacterium sp.]